MHRAIMKFTAYNYSSYRPSVTLVSILMVTLYACEDPSPAPSTSSGGAVSAGGTQLSVQTGGQRGGGQGPQGAQVASAGVATASGAEAGREAWSTPDGGPVESAGGSVTITEEGEELECRPVLCREKLLACGDCVDNDGDGKTDWRDPECLGPCDNTEGPGLNSGVGGETRASCSIDCYFDFGNGSGNDQCYWDHRCDPLTPEPACGYEPERVGSRDCPSPQAPRCEESCLALTPNGCDCFGCCTLPGLESAGPNGERAFVWIGHLNEENVSTCTLDSILDTERCPRCTPAGACLNDCGRCELCLGKTELPEDCFEPPPAGVEQPQGGRPGGGGERCEEGVPPCGHQLDEPCLEPYYCVTGCCRLSLQRGK